MSVADDFRAAVKLMAYQPPGHSARTVGVPQDVPNYSAKGLSGASVSDGLSGAQSGLGALGQGLSGMSQAYGTISAAAKGIASIFA